MAPEVTAIITTHARPRHVHEALASVRAETHADLEIVVVDDGGTFALPPSDRGGEVRVVRGTDLGIGRARNLGLAAARGEFVIFLDDDDVAFPHRIASLTHAARRVDAALCFGRTRRVVDGASIVLEDVPTHAVSAGAVGFHDVLTCAPHINAVLARTEALRAAGGFDVAADHFDDWSAWLRVADRGGKLWSIADTVAEWRIHAEGLSARVLDAGAMKRRLIGLFERLATDLSDDGARAVAAARRVVDASAITTYDDYVEAMSALTVT